MEDEIFENLMQVLWDYAEEVRNLYKARLLNDDKKATGHLIDSVETFVVYNNTEFLVTLRAADYLKYVEEGISPAGKYKNPGWKAYPFILKWVEIKQILPHPKSGNLPRTQNLETLYKQSAYLVTRKIVEKGIDAGHQLRDTVEAVNSFYLPKLEEALQKDFDKYAIYVLKDIDKMIKL